MQSRAKKGEPRINLFMLNRVDKSIIYATQEALLSLGVGLMISLEPIHVPFTFMKWNSLNYDHRKILEHVKRVKSLIGLQGPLIGVGDLAVDVTNEEATEVFDEGVGLLFTRNINVNDKHKFLRSIGHITGHALGLKDCQNRCIMNHDPNKIAEEFCHKCSLLIESIQSKGYSSNG
jgi:predicted Zn-dependent protease